MGIAAGSVGLSELMQKAPSTDRTENNAQPGQDLVAVLENLKRALDAGLIDQSEFIAAKTKALGL
ncbi:hypothetical protein ABIE62_002897 [Porphyrobacter sp. MBR-155]|jgi:hypothetical protein|uniref:SHOCT domain-containing protein n=1 Tax=Porphyrobacter sp. MBR-155 TaxID=3156464 RepID=UPI0033980831